MIMKLLRPVSIAVLYLAVVPATARSIEDQARIVVSFEQRELASTAGIDALKARLQRASVRICADDPSALMATFRAAQCERRAFAGALAQLDSLVAAAGMQPERTAMVILSRPH